MKTYLVGGAVRDKLLQYPTKDRDWVVVGANVDQMLSLGYQPVGADFPVFLHPDTKEEYALARTERKTDKGYQGFSFYAAEDVTLEQDLSRRDLTINAIAEAEDGTLVDPFNGQQDIQQRTLRHVSSAFSEDPLRVLRVARFAARYAHLGFTIAPQTLQIMSQISASQELQHLSSERVWQEIESAIMERSPLVFFKTLDQTDALRILLPTFSQLMSLLETQQSTVQCSILNSLNSAAKRIAWFNFISQLDQGTQTRSTASDQLASQLRCSKHTKYLITQTSAIMELLKNWNTKLADEKLSFIQSAGLLRDNTKLTELLEIVQALLPTQSNCVDFESAIEHLKKCVKRIREIDHKTLIKNGFVNAELGAEIKRIQLAICQQ